MLSGRGLYRRYLDASERHSQRGGIVGYGTDGEPDTPHQALHHKHNRSLRWRQCWHPRFAPRHRHDPPRRHERQGPAAAWWSGP